MVSANVSRISSSITLISLSLLLLLQTSNDAHAEHDIRLSWGAYFSSSPLSNAIPYATPQLDIGYRFMDRHLGIYLDLTYHYAELNFSDHESYEYNTHYFRAGITMRCYPYLSDIFDVYVAAGVGIELSRFVYHESDDYYQPLDRDEGSFGAPKFEIGMNFSLTKHFYLGFKATTLISFYEEKPKYIRKDEEYMSYEYIPFQVGVDLVASYRF